MPPTPKAVAELKVRIPRELMTKIDRYWHKKELRTRKHAVVELLQYAITELGPKEPKEENER